MKNILLMVPRLNIGGAETYTKLVAENLQKRGYNVHIASGGGLLANKLAQKGIKNSWLPMRFSTDISAYLLKYIVKKYNIDLIHANSAAAGITAMKYKQRYNENMPVVFTVHGILGDLKKENILKGIRLTAKIPKEYLGGLCRIGIPTAIQGMAYCAISMVLTRMVSAYGAEAVATQRVGGQIESISWNTADGFAAALNAFIAQNYGAGKMDRVRKGYRASLWTVGIWGLLISFVFICFPQAIADIFFHEPKAVATAVGYLVIIGFSEAFMCVELTTVGALSGLGRTRLCSIISITFTSARIPLAIILGGLIGLSGIWWALSVTSIIKGIIFTCTFLWITRKRG